jgi:hypothetical protein
VGIAHHLGWAVVVTASADHEVVDRRRIELIEPGMPTAPIEHEAKPLSDDATARMVAEVRASTLRATSASLDQLAASLPEPIVSMSLRAWPLDFPDDIVVQRRPPYESRADSVMYCQVLSECAHVRGWDPSLIKLVRCPSIRRALEGQVALTVVRAQQVQRPGSTNPQVSAVLRIGLTSDLHRRCPRCLRCRSCKWRIWSVSETRLSAQFYALPEENAQVRKLCLPKFHDRDKSQDVLPGALGMCSRARLGGSPLRREGHRGAGGQKAR